MSVQLGSLIDTTETAISDVALRERIFNIRLVAFDFDGVFTDNMVYVNQDGSEAVRCNRSDGIGLRRLESMGVETIIISTETNPVVTARARKLEVLCIQGCEDKRTVLSQILLEKNLVLDQVAFVGNDVNDQPCLEIVGLPIVVNDAHPDVLSHAVYRTQLRGGYGAVREICDLLVSTLES